MSEIKIFSSSEADDYVAKLHLYLTEEIQNHGLFYQCGTWRNPVTFSNGGDTIAALIEYAKGLKSKKGYAVFFFAPDDDAVIRGEEYYVARDNDWLEFGLFSAILGTSNVFAIFPKSPVKKQGVEKKWHHPTDFAIQHRTYEFKDDLDQAKTSLQQVASDIAAIILNQNSIKSTPHNHTDGIGFNPKSL